MFAYFEERMTDSGVSFHSHGQGQVGGGGDGELADWQQQGEQLGVPVISPHPQQTRDHFSLRKQRKYLLSFLTQ